MVEQEIIDDVEIFTKKIMDDEGVAEYDLKIEGQTEKGVNYAGEIIFFSATSRTDGKKYNFVMKTSRRTDNLRKAMGDGVLDVREMHMYSKVFPAIRKFLATINSNYQLDSIVKTYLVNTEVGHETTIMEDLRSKGYRLWNKRQPMNPEHIKVVLSNYGKYHASSIALRVKEPKIFEDLTKDMESPFKHFLTDETVTKLFGDYVEDALNVLTEFGLHEVVEKLREVPKNALSIVSKTAAEEDKVVITHGDCWINNMMFKYESKESLKPLGVCLLDFQISTFGSPASDLSYYLYTSCDEETITNQFEQLLEIYYDSLSSTLKNFGLNAEDVLTYQDLKRHWSKYAINGLIMAAQVIKVQLTTMDESPDFKDFEDGKGLSFFRIGEIKDNDIYKRRILAVFNNYAKYCLN